MKKIMVLFNLRDGVEVSAYEDWARSTDLPTARGLGSVESFNIYRAEGLFGSDDAPPYQYAEWLEVTALDALGADAQSDAMAAVIAAFGNFADNPLFVVMENIE